MFENKTKKLRLNKDTIRALTGTEMQGVAGGKGPVGSGGSHGCTCTCKCQVSAQCSLTCPKAPPKIAFFAF